MKPQTRDNLIYLAVGLGIAALLVVDVFYSESRGREMWSPSKFSLELVTTGSLVAYFVIRETRKAKATFNQVAACLLLSTFVHLTIGFGFQRTIGSMSGSGYSVLAIIEIYVIVQLSLWLVQYFRS